MVKMTSSYFVDPIIFQLLAFCWSGAVGRMASQNIARGKPTWQISVYQNEFPSNLVVDGNRNSNLLLGSCLATYDHWYPWWAVDLGRVVYTEGVNVVNRGDCCANRLDNFIVGLTNTSVLVVAPQPFQYGLCGRFPGAAGLGASLYVRCVDNAPPARYVIIQMAVYGSINFCEVEVYVRRIQWITLSGVRMIGKTVSNMTVDHTLLCMNACTLSADCDSFNFRSTNNECQLNKHGNNSLSISRAANFVSDTDWTWWSSEFVSLT